MRIHCIGALAVVLVIASICTAQNPAHTARVEACVKAGWSSELAEQGAIAVERLVAMQEDPGQWPYEGVYRVGGEIPVGYRIGGTSICGESLLTTPGYADDSARKVAVERAIAFVCAGRNESLMNPVTYKGGYDVRAWGHCYGARFLLLARKLGAVPAGLKDEVESSIDWYVDAIQKMEIAKIGGWNYALQGDRTDPSPVSPFMTPPCLESLFLAREQGETVDAAIVERALKALEMCRGESGYFDYSAQRAIKDQPKQIPGSVGRMCAGEAALVLASRGSTEHLASAVNAFHAHWDALEARRAKSGTHLAPYGVAPYYFMFAHWRAAIAVQLASTEDRPALRAKVLECLARTRATGGTWNDRVFPRSANFGTACALLVLGAPTAPPPAGWAELPKKN